MQPSRVLGRKQARTSASSGKTQRRRERKSWIPPCAQHPPPPLSWRHLCFCCGNDISGTPGLTVGKKHNISKQGPGGPPSAFCPGLKHAGDGFHPDQARGSRDHHVHLAGGGPQAGLQPASCPKILSAAGPRAQLPVAPLAAGPGGQVSSLPSV